MIIGETEKDIPSSFLVTEKTFGDFILEAEFKIEPEINSGIQIRSHVYSKDTTSQYVNGSLVSEKKSWPSGTIHGYQIEIDPSERAWTGGFYEEGNRGWLQPLKGNPEAQHAFKPGDWNHFRIEAKGTHFKSFINGIVATDTTDLHTQTGFIGLQLHGAWKEEQVGKKVWFRNLRIKFFD